MKNFKKGDIVGFRASKACYSIGVLDKLIVAGDGKPRAIVHVIVKKTFIGLVKEKGTGSPLAKDLIDESKQLDEFPEWFI